VRYQKYRKDVKHKKKRRHRRTRAIRESEKYQYLFHDRFPRLRNDEETELFLQLGQMRRDFPPPKYSKTRDGAWNPAEIVISWLVNIGIIKLRERCSYHGLSDDGTHFDLIKSVYLHWRAGKVGLPPYGAGFPRDHEPQCACGMMKPEIKRFPRLQPRFPRLLRFPRLGGLDFRSRQLDRKWFASYKKDYRMATAHKLRETDILFFMS